MRCRRVGLEAEVIKYESGKGLEDGFAPWTDVVTQGWIVTDFLVKLKNESGTIVCPYIKNRWGYIFIGKNDYIIIEEDGSKHVCGADKIWNRYEKV